MFDLTPDHIESVASNSSITYGKHYYDNGYVTDVKITNNKFIEARVRGQKQYLVLMEFKNGIYNSRCSCPYDRDNFCKHKVAVMMALMDETKIPVKVEISQSQEKLLRLSYRLKEFISKIKN
jgi:uncharacterized Zn finger protein